MIYLDNAASTEPAPEVLDARARARGGALREPLLGARRGAAAARALEKARARGGGGAGRRARRAVFTSGGTEADALGVLGAARAAPRPARRRERARAPGGHALRRDAGRRAGCALDVGRPGRERRRQRRGRRGGRAPRDRRGGGDAGEQRARHASADRRHRPAAGRRRRPQAPTLHVDAVQAFGLGACAPRALGADSVAALRAQAARPAGRRRALAAPGRPAGAAVGRRRPGAGPARRHRERARRWSVSASPRRVARAAVQDGAEDGSPRSAIASSKRRWRRSPAVVPGVRPTVTGAPRAPAHRVAGVPGPARRAAAARARGARRARVGRLGLRVAHGGAQPHASRRSASTTARPCCGSRSRADTPSGRRRRRGRPPLVDAARDARGQEGPHRMESVVLCRFGELFLKSGNRRAFERALADNVRAALADLPGARVEPTHGRVLVRVRTERRRRGRRAAWRACSAWCRSRSRARSTAKPDLEAIAADGRRRRARRDRAAIAPRRFKVEARRSDKRFPQTLAGHRPPRRRARSRPRPACPSTCTRPRCGSASRSGPTSRYVFAGTHAAPGGLPVGRSGRALLLLSGGIDSPVAGWLAAKRGLALDARLLPLAAVHRREVARQGARAGQAARALAGAAFGDRRTVHRRAEAPARRRPRRAGRGALPPHDDAHRRRDRRPAGGRARW